MIKLSRYIKGGERLKKKKDQNFVVKANDLIEAKMHMGLLEQKIFLTLVSEITPQDKDFQEYEFPIGELADLMEIKDSGSVYRNIHTSAKKMMQKIITIENDKTIMTTALLSSCETPKGQGIIKLTFHPFLKPYLLEIKGEDTNFTKYRLENILKLKSTYAIRIYELLKQYQNTKHKSREFTMQDLREKLCLGNKYSLFTNFENRILAVAKSEINEKTDIWINYKKIKKGTTIDRIIFEIEPKYGTVDQEAEEIKLYKASGSFDFEELRDKSGLAGVMLSEGQVMELYEIACNKTDSKSNGDPYEYIKRNYYYTLSKNPANLYSYLKKAIDNDFAKVMSI